MGVFEPAPEVSRIDLASEPEFEVGGLTVKPSERAVVRNGERRELQPRVMRVLIALAQARPVVVSRDRLIERCWEGRIVGDDALNRCILALRHLAREFAPEPFTIKTIPRVGHQLVESGGETAAAGRRTRPGALRAIGATAILAVLAATAFILSWSGRLLYEDSPTVPTVLVTAAADDARSRQLANELVTQLGILQAAHPASIRLLGGPSSPSVDADLVLQVSRVADRTAAGATAVLTEQPSRTILWSNEFEHPSRNVADLRQQVAYTAAHVLRCASEGLASEDPLTPETLKTYLSACGEMSDAAAYDARPVVSALENVVSRSPGFVAGWAKLLQAETEALASPVVPASAGAASALKRHILAARRLKADLPEAYLAEVYLTRPVDFVARARLLQQAVKQSPHHAGVRSFRALFYSSVGAMDDAVREAREAVRLDPLSPGLRDAYVAALAAAGDTSAALAEVAEVERLWPGASGAIEARYRVHLRYGDPRVALGLIQSRAIDMPAVPLHRTFLEARIEPSPRNVERAIRQHRSAYREYPAAIDLYAQALAQFNRKDELLDVLLNPRDVAQLALNTEALFRPAFNEIHGDPQFMRVANSVGLLNYWRTTRQWPDFCFELDLPYDCRKEAAKLG